MHSWRLSFKHDLLPTSYFQNTVEHRKPSAKMHLRLKDNKPCLVSSGHFLRTDRLVHTRHLVHAANGRLTLHLIPRPVQSSPSVWADPHSPGHPVFSCCYSETNFEEASLKPLSESLLLVCSHGEHRTPEERSALLRAACAVPAEQPGVFWGVTGRWQSTVVLRLKAKEK